MSNLIVAGSRAPARQEEQPVAERRKPPGQPKAKPAAKRHRDRNYGVPLPCKFDIDKLPDSAWLTNTDVAAVLRRARGTVEGWRQRPDGGPIPFEYLDNKPVYRAHAVRAFIASRRTDCTKGK
jgi:hypothetical protein